MKKLIYLLMLFVLNLFSQEESLENQFKLEYNLLGVGVSYEIPISEKFLIDFGAGVGGGVDNAESYVWDFNSSLAAYFKGEFKYLYNREKRLKKGKSLENNAGNYIAFQTKYFTGRFSEIDIFNPLNRAILNEFHWGLQRSLGGNWLFNFHIGFGFLRNIDEDYNLLSPALGLKFSYKLF
ncbi:hypothetical protein [Polaribacter sp.]|uniref:hypothetical protein n=1 Tax=Polaribacter sp. TaxID=1920175 RepID=UPI004048C711